MGLSNHLIFIFSELKKSFGRGLCSPNIELKVLPVMQIGQWKRVHACMNVWVCFYVYTLGIVIDLCAYYPNILYNNSFFVMYNTDRLQRKSETELKW